MQILGVHWVEWIGYIASVCLLISLAMTSIIRLRIYNFIGCITFAYYGYLTGAIPVIVANLSIAAINVYCLYQIFTTKTRFTLLIAELDSAYFHHFWDTYQKELRSQTPLTSLTTINTCFYVVYDDVITGILGGNKNDDGFFEIKIDFITASYRDFKINDHDYFDKLNEYGITSIKKGQPHASALKKHRL